MKKSLLLGICSAILLQVGCTKNTNEESVTSTNDSSVNVWHVLPQVDATEVKNLAPFSQMTIRDGDKEVSLTYNQTGYLNASNNNSYTDNAIVIQNDDVQSIYDYNGNLLYTMTSKVSDTFHEEGIVTIYAYVSNEEHYLTQVYGTKTDKKASILNTDFASITELTTDALIFHPYDGNQVFDEMAIQNGTVGILSHLKSNSGEDQAGYEFNAYSKTALPDMYIAKSVSSSLKDDGYVICDATGKILSKVTGQLYSKTSGQFVNGYYPAYQKDDDSKKIALIHASDGKSITDYLYSDVGYFEDGYCPVKNTEGKWAYINESGEEVTDFIFDSASSLYQGKAWVVKDNKAGVINLSASKNGKLTDSIFSLNESDAAVEPDATNAPEQSNSNIIGTLKVKVSSLNIRKDAGVKNETNGTATSGETYEVFETKEADGYTWYRIGENQWVAGSDEWVTYTKK